LDALIAAARAVHFFCALLMFGELVFVLAVGPAARSPDARTARLDVSPRALRVLAWTLAGSVASALVWLAVEAVAMSGLPAAQALGPDTMSLVLAETTFGHVWLLRLALVIAFAVVLFALRRSQRSTRSVLMIALVIAAGYLCALAWSGHAGAAAGPQRYIHLPSDVLHLLAAGAWLGALPALVRLLGSAPRIDEASHAVRRFSTLGLAAVGVLVLSGAVNAWFLVGSIPALFGTDYGRLLLAKLALVAVMLTLAAVNRLALTPRLARQDGVALRLLRRNAMLETTIGIVVVSIVAVLGITIPAAHESRDRTPMPSSEGHMH
jgi:putative copper resistance protein D